MERSQKAMRWGMMGAAALTLVAGSFDCVGFERNAAPQPVQNAEARVDQASDYWEAVAPEPETDRPISVETCLAFTAAQAIEQALEACAIAYEEDGGADVAEALEGARALLAGTEAAEG